MNPHFELSCVQSYTAVQASSEPHLLYLLAQIHMLGRVAALPPTPLQIVLVIDRSRSMQGERLGQVCAAIRQLALQLRPSDQLALISFNDRARVIIPLQPVHDQQAITQALNQIEATGGTEISSGLTAAADELRRVGFRAGARRLILLTDGQTYGDEDRCLSLVRHLQGQGVGFTAIGLGEDWNEALLQAIGAGPASRALYLPRAGKVGTLMLEDLQRARTMIVPDLTLHITTVADLAIRSIDRVEPFIAPLSALPLDVTSYAVPLDGWTALDRHMVLIELQVAPLRVGAHQLVRLALSHSHANVPLAPPPPPLGCVLTVQPYAVADAAPHATVVNYLEHLTAYRLQESAWRELAAGNTKRAYDHLMMARTRLLQTQQLDLAHVVAAEATRLLNTHAPSAAGRKQIAFGTRGLSVS